jgi:hypothetical protein
VAIDVQAVGDRFTVVVTPPHGEWHSDELLSPTDVLRKLSAIGCHSADITDALDASGANWRPDTEGLTPDVVATTLSDAIRIIEAARLAWEARPSDADSPVRANDVVVSQSPVAGYPVAASTVVRLRVSSA